MADNTSIHEQLKAGNPFLSVASPLPWANKTPDVSQLYSSISADIEQLIRDKRREPSLPLSGLIFGGQGMGKTHMLTRILRRLRKNAWHAIFVDVKAFTNPKRITQELLFKIFVCMSQMHSNGHSQFDVLMSEMMNAYHEHRAEDGLSGDDDSSLKTYLKKDMPGLNRTFLKCLLLYIKAGSLAVKDNILEWLREGLDDEDSLALGLPMREVGPMDDAACESDAKAIITSLGLVLAYAKITMIICFDELDTMEGNKELIDALGNTIGFLMNNVSGILPLCFVKEDSWDNAYVPTLNRAIIQRLRTNIMKMNGCSVEQAKQLIHDRIASVFSDNAEEVYNWLISRMGSALTPGLSPRMVIELAKKAIDTDPPDPVKEAFNEEYKKVQDEPRAWPPNSDHMKLAAEAWLKSHDGYDTLKGWGKHLRIFGTLGDKHIALALPVPKTAPTAMAVINECFRFLKEYPGSFCCYVKEKKAHKDTWKVFAKRLGEFVEAGGHVLELDESSRITWYALAATISQIKNGNVTVFSPESRTATTDDAREFFRTIDLIPGIFAQPQPETDTGTPDTPVPPVSPELLKTALHNVIKSSPMKLLTTDKALAILASRNIILSRNDVLSFVEANKHSFRTYSTSSGEIMIGLTGK